MRAFPSILLIALATALGVIALITNWLDREALDTPTWVERSAGLLEDEDVRRGLAEQVIEQVPGASSVTDVDAIAALLADPDVVGLWKQANSTVHAQAVAVLDESAAAGELGVDPSLELDLDLTAVTALVASKSGIDAATLPSPITVEVFSASELETLRGASDLLGSVALASLIGTVLLYGIAFSIAPFDRRGAAAAIAISLLVVGAATLLLRGGAAAATADGLSGSETSHAAVERTALIGTGDLAALATIVIAIGAAGLATVIVLGVLERRTV